MMLLALSVSVPLSVLTSTLPLAGSVAAPMTTVILFFFIRCPTPPDNCLATPRDRLITASMS